MAEREIEEIEGHEETTDTVDPEAAPTNAPDEGEVEIGGEA